MPPDPINPLVRRLDDLSTEDFLRFHREVCRRAAAIYGPMYKTKRDANHRTGMTAARGKRG